MRFVRNTGQGGPSLALAAIMATLLVWGCSSTTDPGDGPGDPPANNAPTASAGPDLAVSVGLGVTVDGSGSSDADGDPITYAWTLTPPAGSAATLDDATSETPGFVPDVEGAYVLSLKVNDGEAESAADQATVTATNNTVATAIVAADGGSVASSDGSLALSVPAGALGADTEISVTLVSESQLPAVIAGIPGEVKAYDLGPDGTTFSTPVEVGFEVPGAVTTSSASAALSAALLYAESGGTVESMADVTMVQDDVDPSKASITGNLSHFSHAIFVASSMEFRIDAPAQVEAGTPFDVTFTVDITGAGLGGVGSASVEDASLAVAPDEGFVPAMSGSANVVSVTNSYTCPDAGEARIRAFMQFEATDDFGSVVRIQLGKALTCTVPPPPLETTFIAAAKARRLLPVPGSDTEVTVGGAERRIDLDAGALTYGTPDAGYDEAKWVFALSDGSYLGFREASGQVYRHNPTGDPDQDSIVSPFDQPRHVSAVNENLLVVASAFGDLGLIDYVPGAGFNDTYRNLTLGTGPQQSGTNLQAIWASPDGSTFIGAVTEGDGDPAFNNTRAAILVPNDETGAIDMFPLPDIIDLQLDFDRRHEFNMNCREQGSALYLCVFTSSFEYPANEDVEGDGYMVIFYVDTFEKTASGVYYEDQSNTRVGGGIFPLPGGGVGVAVGNQFTREIDIWHLDGSEVVSSFSAVFEDTCTQLVDFVLVGDGAHGAAACFDGVIAIRNLNGQAPPVAAASRQ